MPAALSRKLGFRLLLEALLLLSARLAVASATAPVTSNEPAAPVPDDIQIDSRRAALGERLFDDVRLSRGRQQSCATCHPLDRGGMDGRVVAVRPNGKLHIRNTPTVFNVGLSASYNWDGVASTLEEHAELVLTSPGLMNITWPELLARLRADRTYVSAFRRAFPDGLTRANVLSAIAVFQRSLLTAKSRFDRYLRGDRDAMTPPELEGYRLFKRYGCTTCHQGVNIGGNLYARFGVFADVETSGGPVQDLGRIRVTGAARDRHVFRVPSLRNVAATAPYFHDGRERTVEGAVELMAEAQLGRKLTREQTALIVRFLNTLTGEYRGRPVGPAPVGSR
jgi:cytochrome c peroxidase